MDRPDPAPLSESMNSTRTWVTLPVLPVRPRTLLTLASLKVVSFHGRVEKENYRKSRLEIFVQYNIYVEPTPSSNAVRFILGKQRFRLRPKGYRHGQYGSLHTNTMYIPNVHQSDSSSVIVALDSPFWYIVVDTTTNLNEFKCRCS